MFHYRGTTGICPTAVMSTLHEKHFKDKFVLCIHSLQPLGLFALSVSMHINTPEFKKKKNYFLLLQPGQFKLEITHVVRPAYPQKQLVTVFKSRTIEVQQILGSSLWARTVQHKPLPPACVQNINILQSLLCVPQFIKITNLPSVPLLPLDGFYLPLYTFHFLSPPYHVQSTLEDLFIIFHTENLS